MYFRNPNLEHEIVTVTGWDWAVIWKDGENWRVLDYHVSRDFARARVKGMGVRGAYKIAYVGGRYHARIAK